MNVRTGTYVTITFDQMGSLDNLLVFMNSRKEGDVRFYAAHHDSKRISEYIIRKEAIDLMLAY